MPRVTVGVARKRTLTAQWLWEPSIGQNLHPFTGNGDVSMSVKNPQVGRKSRTNKRTTKRWKINAFPCFNLDGNLANEYFSFVGFLFLLSLFIFFINLCMIFKTRMSGCLSVKFEGGFNRAKNLRKDIFHQSKWEHKPALISIMCQIYASLFFTSLILSQTYRKMDARRKHWIYGMSNYFWNFGIFVHQNTLHNTGASRFHSTVYIRHRRKWPSDRSQALAVYWW